MRYSFIYIYSFMHSMCFSSCFPTYEMKLDVTAKKAKLNTGYYGQTD
jgi:hypothetical protein